MENYNNNSSLTKYYSLITNVTIAFGSAICVVYPTLSDSRNMDLWLLFSVFYLILYFVPRKRADLLLILGTVTIFTMAVNGEELNLQIWLLMPPLFSSVLIPGRPFIFHSAFSFLALLSINVLRFDEVNMHLILTCIGAFVLTVIYSYLLSFRYIRGLEEIIDIKKQNEAIQEKEKLLLLELEQTKSFKSMSLLAAGVSDEFGNLLRAISNTNQALKELASQAQPISPSKVEEITQTNDAILKRSEDLLKTFAKPDSQSTTDMLDLREILDSTLVILRGHILEDVDIIDNLGDRSWITGPRETVESLFLNLIKNSVEANATSISISFQQVGNRRELLVEDNGIGIPPDIDVFKPFTTTKESGTGIGMYFIKERLTQMNANIEIDRRQNPTVFRVIFRNH